MVMACKALKRRDHPITMDSVKSVAGLLDLWKPCREPVQTTEIPKDNGEMRPIVTFGPERLARDLMLHRMLQARFTPHPDQFNLKGRGRDRAINHIINSAQGAEGRHVVVADFRDAYGSIGREILDELPVPSRWLHNALIANVPCVNRQSLGAETNRGVPQGAAASSLILAAALKPLLDQLPSVSRNCLYGDDYCGVCPSEDAAAETRDAFEVALGNLHGLFVPKHLGIYSLTEGFNFLGYVIWKDATGSVRVEISDNSVEKFLSELLRRAEANLPLENLTKYKDSWLDSYPNAQDGDGYREIIHSYAQEALIIVECSRLSQLAQPPEYE
jgi:Reverse transcriptase (RNA-dependent DNA polymerase)